jgi:hypothetical protein
MSFDYKRMKAQIKKILVDKWDEGIKRGSDPGEEFMVQWVNKYADEFSAKWEKSKCRTCVAVEDCGFKLTDCCEFYSQERGVNGKKES